jgi:phosphoglycolate phosphatase
MPIIHASELQKPQAILLDWDNTLTDSWPIIYQSLKKTFEHFGMEPWSFEDVLDGRGNIHHSMRASFPAIFGDKWNEASDVYINAFLGCHLEFIKPLPGAVKTINKVKEKGLFQAVVSNKTGKHLREEVKHLNLEANFDKVVGATDATRDKPHADPIYLALSESALQPAEYYGNVWMVGDTKTDVLAAIAAGATPVLFGHHWKLEDEILNNHKIYHVEDHTDFLQVVEKF